MERTDTGSPDDRSGSSRRAQQKPGAGAPGATVDVGDVGDVDLRQVDRLAAAHGRDDDRFGEAIAVNSTGDVVIVGAPGSFVPGIESDGTAYVFTERVGTYVQTARVTPGAAEGADEFGAAVDLNAAGDVALVGRPGQSSVAAAVYERRDSRWIRTATLSPPDDERFDGAGSGEAVALDAAGDTAAVGTPSTNEGGTVSSGGALLFERREVGWSDPIPLAHRFGTDNHYGAAVALDADGTLGLVGAPASDANGEETVGGWVDVVRRTDGGWKRTTRLQTADPNIEDLLGATVACDADGKVVVAGRPDGDASTGQREASSAVAFRRTPKGWRQDGTLDVPSDASEDFGSAVAVDDAGRIALVGAPGQDTDAGAGADAGSASLYTRERGEWRQRTRAVASNVAAGDTFGQSVDLDASGNTAVVGAPSADVDDPGSAFVYVRD